MKLNGFEAGSSAGEGTAVSLANSTAAGEDAWFANPTTGTGGTIVYTQTNATMSAWCAKFSQATAANQPVMVQFNEGAGSTAFATRIYLYMTGLPSADMTLIQIRTTADAQSCAAQLTSTGQLKIINNAGTVYGLTTATMTTSTWYRIEFYATGVNGTTGTMTGAFFTGHNAAAVETVGTTGTVSTPLVNVDRVRYGRMSAVTFADWYMDHIAVNMGAATPFGPATSRPKPLLIRSVAVTRGANY